MSKIGLRRKSLALVAMASLLGGSLYATFTESTSTEPQHVTTAAGTITLTGGSLLASIDSSVSDLVPGDSVSRTVAVKNDSSYDFASIQLDVSDAVSGTPFTSSSQGLRLSVARCTDATYATCTTILNNAAPTDAANGNAPVIANISGPALVAGATDHLKVTQRFEGPDTAKALKAARAELVYTFVATQRAGNAIPGAPLNLQATGTSGAIDLSWGAATSPVPPTYTVFRNNVQVASLGNVTSWSDTTVVAGNSYTYVVRAINPHGTGPASNSASVQYNSGLITTVSGTSATNVSNYWGDGGPAIYAGMNGPRASGYDSAGNLYITDIYNYRIRKVDTSGVITTVLGNGSGVFSFSPDGTAGTAMNLNLCAGSSGVAPVAVASNGDIYFYDCASGNRIRKLTVSSGTISTIAGGATSGFSGDGGQATSALVSTNVIDLTYAGDSLYISDAGNNRVRKIDGSGIITTVAGNGTTSVVNNVAATSSGINGLMATAVDASGNVYYSEYGGHRIRKVAAGIVTTMAGTGSGGYNGDQSVGTNAQLFGPMDVAVEASGNIVFCDQIGGRIRRINTSTGAVTTPVGVGVMGGKGYSADGAAASSASLSHGTLAINSSGTWALGGYSSNDVRTVSGGVMGTVSSGLDMAPGTLATAISIRGAYPTMSAAGDLFFSQTSTYAIYKVTPAGVISRVAGTGVTQLTSGDGGQARVASFGNMGQMATDSSGNLYIYDGFQGYLRKINAATGVITSIGGNGQNGGTPSGDGGQAVGSRLALYNGSNALAVASNGDIYFPTQANTIRKITAATGVISTIAGTGTAGYTGEGAALSVRFNNPQGLGFDAAGSLYVMDRANTRIRKINLATGTTSLVVDHSSIGTIESMVVDSTGTVYASSASWLRVRKLAVGASTFTNYAGTGSSGTSSDGIAATSAPLNGQLTLALHPTTKDLYLTETKRVRKITY